MTSQMIHCRCPDTCRPNLLLEDVYKGKGKRRPKANVDSIAPSRGTSKALRHGSHNFTCKQHHACLYLVSVHQMAPSLIVVADI